MQHDRDRQIVAVIATSTSDGEKEALAKWASQLLEIRASALSPMQKVKQALSLTARSKILWPAVKIMSRELKRRGWDERGQASRFGLAGALTGLVVFGGQGAGIAALGTAIGVPLWVVLGSGAAFAGVMVDEFAAKGRVEAGGFESGEWRSQRC